MYVRWIHIKRQSLEPQKKLGVSQQRKCSLIRWTFFVCAERRKQIQRIDHNNHASLKPTSASNRVAFRYASNNFPRSISLSTWFALLKTWSRRFGNTSTFSGVWSIIMGSISLTVSSLYFPQLMFRFHGVLLALVEAGRLLRRFLWLLSLLAVVYLLHLFLYFNSP